ncbi:MAG: hypothetical protein WC050_02870, partial [Candidatus Paceibacterota bacterium]
MTNEINIGGRTLISSKDAGATFDLSPDYISRLCREGKVEGQQIGRTWYTDSKSLSAFLDQRGEEKKQLAEELRDQRVQEYRAHKKTVGRFFTSPAPRPEIVETLQPIEHTLNDLFPTREEDILTKPVSGTRSVPLSAKKISRLGPIAVFPVVIVASLFFSVSAFAMIDPATFKNVADAVSSRAHHAYVQVYSVIENVRAVKETNRNLAAANVTLDQAVALTTTTDASTSLAGVAASNAGPLVISDTLVPRPDFNPGSIEVGVPLFLAKSLSVDGAARVGGALTAGSVSGSSVYAGSLTVAGTARFNGDVFATGPAIFSGTVSARGGIKTAGADVDLQGGRVYASNVVNGIKAGTNVTITGTTNNPIISVNVPFYGGGGGGGSVTRISSGAGLTGDVTTTGSIALDLGSANTWTALQTFSGGASSSFLTLSTALGIASGGTGTSTVPTYGQILVGDGSGGYTFAATSTIGASLFSSLGTTTYLTDLAANLGVGTSSAYAKLTTWGEGPLFEAVNNSSSTIFSIGQYGATTTNFAITGATSSVLKTDAFGNVGAAVEGTDFLSANSINTSAKLAGILTDETGTAGSVVFSASPTFTGTANFVSLVASGTATFRDLVTFEGGFTSLATSSIVGGLTISDTATTSNFVITSATSSLLKTNSLGQVIPAVAGVDYATAGSVAGAESWQLGTNV